MLISANKMYSFIRFLLETNNFLESKLPCGGSLTWNIKDRLSCQSFIDEVLMKLIEKEIRLFGLIRLNYNATWHEAMFASSNEKVRMARVHLSVVKRLRDLLRLISLCLRSSADLIQAADSSLLQMFTDFVNSTTIRGTIDIEASLTSEDFSDLLREFSQIKELPRTKDYFTTKSSKTADVNLLNESDAKLAEAEVRFTLKARLV